MDNLLAVDKVLVREEGCATPIPSEDGEQQRSDECYLLFAASHLRRKSIKNIQLASQIFRFFVAKNRKFGPKSINIDEK